MAFALENPRELQAILEIRTIGHALVDDEADADDRLVADASADRLVNHEPEACPVLRRAAETVGALVGAR